MQTYHWVNNAQIVNPFHKSNHTDPGMELFIFQAGRIVITINFKGGSNNGHS